MTDPIELHAIEQMKKANTRFVAALNAAQKGYRPAVAETIVWGRDYPMNSNVVDRYASSYVQRRDDTIEELGLRVDNRCCFQCGARLAHGCEHSRPPLEI